MRRTLGKLAVAALILAAVPWSVSAQSRRLRFTAHLTGLEEVPVRQTDAVGQTIFVLSPDRTQIHYRLIVDDITNVVASHIHVGAFGTNGPIVAFLAGPLEPGGGPFEGVLAEGTITDANLVGPLAGLPLSALIGLMESGGTYVNVHTNDGIEPINTGPGDFPGGEIRGQIAHKGRSTVGGPSEGGQHRTRRD